MLPRNIDFQKCCGMRVQMLGYASQIHRILDIVKHGLGLGGYYCHDRALPGSCLVYLAKCARQRCGVT